MERDELMKAVYETLESEPKLDADVVKNAKSLSPEELAVEIRGAYAVAEAAREDLVIVRSSVGSVALRGRGFARQRSSLPR